jgi:hypothetical protein
MSQEASWISRAERPVHQSFARSSYFPVKLPVKKGVWRDWVTHADQSAKNDKP